MVERRLRAAMCVLYASAAYAGNTEHPDNPHYTATGFFDLHVCNWPDEPPFYLALFSTDRYDDIESILLYSPDGGYLGALSPRQYQLIHRAGKPDKRVFMSHIPLTPGSVDGWYRAEIHLKNGANETARDFVFHWQMPRAEGQLPADNAEGIDPPERLSWKPIDGAARYQVFIREQWNGDELIYSSVLLDKPWLDLPDGLLEPGGDYRWRVHARDVNDHIQLGDFNAGSQSRWTGFTIRAE